MATIGEIPSGPEINSETSDESRSGLDWRLDRVADQQGRYHELLVRPLDDCPFVVQCVEPGPRLVLDQSARPRISFTAILSRVPKFEDRDIGLLIENGLGSIEITTLPAIDVTQLPWRTRFVPLFALQTSLRLVVKSSGQTVAESVVRDGVSRCAIPLSLNADTARMFFNALRGQPADLQIAAEIMYRTVDGTQSLKLSRDLAEILVDCLPGKLPDDFLKVICKNSTGGMTPLPFRFSQSTRHRTRSAEQLEMVGDDHSAASRALRMRPQPGLTIRPHALAASSATTLLQANRWDQTWLVDDLRIGRISWLQDRLTRPRPLPVLDPAMDALWPDKLNPRQYWYAPDYQFIQPTATVSADDSPFLFSFQIAGHDIHGQPGLEAKVRVTLQRCMSAETASQWEALGNPQLQPVDVTAFSVQLEIPYRDESGGTQTIAIASNEIDNRGDISVATFRLSDNWARLAYGSLSVAGYQTKSARISVSYTFEAYVVIKPERIGPISGSSRIVTRLVRDSKAASVLPGDRPHVVADQREIHLNEGVLYLTPPTQRAGIRPATSLIAGTIRPQTLATTSPALLHHPIAVHPQLQTSVLAEVLAQKKQYGIQTQGRTLRRDVLVPCTDFGMLYGEHKEQQFQPIGCRPAWQLGQTESRFYEQLPELWSESRRLFRVFRSLVSPGRFLIAPAAYAITRYAAEDPTRAFQPTLGLFSTIDANAIDLSRCVLMATLQPVLQPFQIRRLRQVLRDQFHPNPTIEYITETDSELTFDWSVGDNTAAGALLKLAIDVVKMWDGFQISIASDARGVPQLQAMLGAGGIFGQANFKLSDGTRCESGLRMALNEIVGPWQAGPLTVTRDGDSVLLENKIESPVCVSELLTETRGGLKTVVLEKRLERSEKWTTSWPVDAETVWPVFAIEAIPQSLPEIRAYIEDIKTNVIFLHVIDFASRQIQRLTINAQIRGVSGLQTIELTEAEHGGEVRFVLPLTQYLADPLLKFQAVVTALDGSQTTVPWRDWPIHRQGNVVSLTWEMLN